MDIQDFIEGMNLWQQRERAATQMTLGGMITALEAMPHDAKVANLNNAHSYRGYYSDLAFERDEDTRLATDLLDECKAVMGQALCGYKGGAFMMGTLTPVWVASYGCSGQKLMALHAGGDIVTAEDD